MNGVKLLQSLNELVSFLEYVLYRYPFQIIYSVFEIKTEFYINRALQQSKDFTDAKLCFEKAATGHIAQRSNWHAAKAMERAGEAARGLEDWQEVEACYTRAAELYMEEGKLDAAAESMVTAAKAMEAPDPKTASKLYQQAIEWVEDAGKQGIASDVYRNAVAHAVRSQRWAEAVSILVRFAAASLSINATNSLCKSYLGAVVLWLYAGDANAAWCTYQDALGVTEFNVSQEAVAAEELINGYRNADKDEIAHVLKRQHCFTHLDPTIARLARKLPECGNLSAMALQIGGSGAIGGALGEEEEGEEDLT